MIRTISNAVRRFLAGIREDIFTIRIEREIYGRIFPHLEREKDCGYPFETDEEIFKRCIHDALDAKLFLNLVERQANAMGKAYGEAFRYIMYRDLNRRLRAYVKLVQHRVPAERSIAKYA